MKMLRLSAASSRLWITLVSSFALATPGIVQATDYTVNVLTDGSPTLGGAGSGTVGDLRYCIMQANYGAQGSTHTIGFAVSGKIKLGGHELVINSHTTINGLGADKTIVDGNGGSRVFYISPDKNVTLNGLKVTNGTGIGNDPTLIDPDDTARKNCGGGILNYGGNLALNGCAVSGNHAPSNGVAAGIYSYGRGHAAQLTINDSTISDNTGGNYCHGGGIYSNAAADGSTVLTMNRCVVSGNKIEGDGGGVISEGLAANATATLSDCTITGNSSKGYHGGGGIINNQNEGYGARNSNMTLNRCVISGNDCSGNSAAGGGGILNGSDRGGGHMLVMRDCTVSGNSSNTTGGGISNYGWLSTANLTLVNCTISGNTSKGGGAGIFNYGYQGTGNLHLEGCTLHGNAATLRGGGIYNVVKQGEFDGNSITWAVNCTIAGNSGLSGGGGIANDMLGSHSSSTVTLSNTLLALNIGANYATASGVGFSGGYNLVDDQTCAAFLTATGDKSNTPAGLVVAAGKPVLKNNGGPTQTIALLPDSAAVDAGKAGNDPLTSLPATTDQRGSARVVDFPNITNAGGGDASDIGAFELTIPAARIAVQMPAGTDLTAGDSLVDFGAVVTGLKLVKTFTIKSTAELNLLLGTPTITGTHAADFTLGLPAKTNLAPGASTTLTVTFTAGALGEREAVLHLPSNDPAGTFDVALTGVSGPKLAVLSGPVSKTVPAGAEVGFQVSVEGIPPITYQWRKNGVVIAGQTGATFSIESAQLTDAGTYSVVVKDSKGTLPTIPSAQLTVVGQIPSSQTLPTDGNASLTVSVAGVVTQYRWMKNGGALPADRFTGGSTKTLAIKKLTLADADSYTCEITGAAGTAVSAPVTLVIQNLPPVFTLEQPYVLPDGIVCGDYAVHNFAIPVDWTTTIAPSSFTAKGLPKGLLCDPTTGFISGRPLVSSPPAKPFNVTITAANAKGKTSIVAALTVSPLPAGVAGAFTGPVERNNSLNAGLGGSFSPVIAVNGKITGTLKMGALSYSLAGSLDVPASGNPTAILIVKRASPLPSLTVAFAVDPSLQTLVDGEINDGTDIASFEAWRKLSSSAVSQQVRDAINRAAGFYTFALKPPANEPTLPEGSGYGSFTIAPNTGTLTGAGKLADGTAFSMSTFAGPSGEVLMYQALYSNKGSIVGSLDIDPGTAEFTPPYGDNALTGTVSWSRPAIAGRLYATGFDPYNLAAVGGRYVAPAPAATAIVMAITDDLTSNNAALAFTGGGVGAPAPGPGIAFRLKAKSAFVAPAAAANPRKTTLTVTPGTGYFTGGFSLTDPNPIDEAHPAVRPSSFYGQIVRDTDQVMRGYGFFLLAELPQTAGETVKNTKQRSGQVLLQKVLP